MNTHPIYVINPNNGIITASSSDVISNYPSNFILIFNPGAFSPKIGYVQDGDLQKPTGYINPWTYWDNDTKLASIRLQRNYLLQQTDWRTIKSVDTDTPESQAWKNYRQELRDFPDVVNVNLPIEQIVWPTPPSS